MHNSDPNKTNLLFSESKGLFYLMWGAEMLQLPHMISVTCEISESWILLMKRRQILLHGLKRPPTRKQNVTVIKSHNKWYLSWSWHMNHINKNQYLFLKKSHYFNIYGFPFISLIILTLQSKSFYMHYNTHRTFFQPNN